MCLYAAVGEGGQGEKVEGEFCAGPEIGGGRGESVMNCLRVEVRELMVEVHRIAPEMADQYVRMMDDVEVERRFRMYTGMELSAAGPTTQSRRPVSAQLPGPATMTAGS